MTPGSSWVPPNVAAVLGSTCLAARRQFLWGSTAPPPHCQTADSLGVERFGKRLMLWLISPHYLLMSPFSYFTPPPATHFALSACLSVYLPACLPATMSPQLPCDHDELHDEPPQLMGGVQQVPLLCLVLAALQLSHSGNQLSGDRGAGLTPALDLNTFSVPLHLQQL